MDRGADVNIGKGVHRGLPLIVAADNNNILTAKYLLEHGADVNGSDDDGETALMKAVFGRHGEMASLLMDSNADVNAKSNERGTAVMHAIVNRDLDSVKNLIKKGVSTDSNLELLITVMKRDIVKARRLVGLVRM